MTFDLKFFTPPLKVPHPKTTVTNFWANTPNNAQDNHFLSSGQRGREAEIQTDRQMSHDASNYIPFLVPSVPGYGGSG